MQKHMLVFLNDKKRWNHEGGEQTEGNLKKCPQKEKIREKTTGVSQTVQGFLTKGGRGVKGWAWGGVEG